MPQVNIPVGDEAPTLGQLRQRVRHLRNHLNRELDALECKRETRGQMAIRRSKVLETQAALELAVAELQAHPEFQPGAA